MADQTVTLRITANAEGLITAIGVAKKETDGLGGEGERAGRRMGAGMGAAERGARSVADQLKAARNQLMGFAAGFAGIHGIRQLASLADQAAGIRAQLQLATDSTKEYARAQSQVFDISQRTSTAMSSTAELYARITRSTAEYGIEQARVLAITETINQTFAVSGTAATAQANAITQLTQAFAGGVLRAEEFNSVIENSPRLAQALADGMGVGMGELRAQVNAGTVDVQRMIDALENQAAKIGKEFSQMPLTIERAWTQIANAVLKYVSDADAASGASAKVAQALSWVAENLDTIIDAALALAKAMAALWTARLLAGVAAYTTQLITQAKQYIINIALARELGIAQQQGFMASLKSIGLVNAALGAAGAALAGWQIGTYLREEFLEVERFGIAMVGGLLKAWERLKTFGIAAWEGIKAAALGAVNTIRSAAATIIGALANANEATDPFGIKSGITDKLREMEQELRPTTSAWDGFRQAVGGALVSMAANEQAIDATIMDMWEFAETQREAAAATDEATESAKNALVTGGLTKEQLDALAKARTDSARALIELAGNTSELAAAEANYKITVMDAVAAANEQLAVGMQRAEVEAQLAASISAATAVLDEQTAAALANQQAHEQVLAELATERKLIGMTESARNKALAGMRTEDAMRKALQTAIKAGAKLSEEAVAARIAEARAAGEATEALAQYAQHLADLGLTDTEISIKIEGLDGDDIADPLWDAVEASDALRDALAGAFALTPAARLRKEIDALTAALNIQGITAEQSGVIQAQLETKRQSLLENNLGLISAGIGSLQSVAEEGSRSAQILEVAQNAVNLALAIGAVVNQGKGDPYTAFARMAAMAAAVVPLVGSIGGMFGGGGGPAENSAAYRQKHQGTGSVLGDSAAKSESIANAVEITADATQQLVGINRGMLNALNAMQAGITGASTLLARGAGDIPEISINGGGGGLSGLFSNIFGGKESLRDQGIRIVGGTLSSMIDSIMVQSYASIHKSGGWFSSSSDRDEFTSLGADVGKQFSLVLGSMADAVRSAADALGLDMEQINARIAAFRIEEIRISTMGLSAEDAQAELEAVFSKLFDDLAGAVVPFVAQFQQIGEGLAETLIRVATGVQVTQEAMIQLGFALDETDPERFAQASEGLMTLMGGVDAFIEGMGAFVQHFATDEHKFAVAQDALTRAFAQAGIEIPASRDAMWDLMQSLDATTESGRKQIAMLLQLAGVSDTYYSMLEERQAALAGIGADIAGGAWQQYLDGLTDAQRAIAESTRYYDDWIASATAAGATSAQLAAIEEQRAVAMGRLLAAQAEARAQAEADYQAAVGDIRDMLDARRMSEFAASMREIGRWSASTTASLHDAARAAGRQSAAEEDLALVHEEAAARAAEAIAALRESMVENAVALGYIDAPDTLDYLNQRITELQNASASAADGIGQAVDAMRNQMDLLLGDLSPYSDRQKLEMARAGLQQGSVTQEQFLQVAQRLFGHTSRYAEEFNFAMRYPGQSSAGTAPDGHSASSSADKRGLAELIAARDALLAQREYDTGQTLARQLAEMSAATGSSYTDIAQSMGWDLAQLADTLSLSDEALTGYLDTLSARYLADTATAGAGSASIVDAIQQSTADLIAAIMGSYNAGDYTGEDVVAGGAAVQPEVIPVANVQPVASGDTPLTAELAALRAAVADMRAELAALREQAGRSADADEATADATAQIAVNTGATVNELVRLGHTRPGAQRSMVGA